MRFREAVFAEAQDLAVKRVGEFGGIAVVPHPLLQPLLELLQAAAPAPRRHRAAQAVGLARREPGGHHGELHDLLLEDRHAQRPFQDFFHLRARIRDRLGSAPAPQVGVHHAALDRPGAHDRHLDHQVVEVLRPEARQHAHLGARFDLEHADGVGLLDHLVGLGVLRRNLVHPHAHHVQCFFDCSKHAERQNVHLH